MIFKISGTNYGLFIKIISYSADVQCVPGPPEFEDRSMCLKLLSIMSTAAARYTFTRDVLAKGRRIWIPPGGKKVLGGTSSISIVDRFAPTPLLTRPSPRVFLGSSQCLGTIDFQQQGDTTAKDLSSWYEMWAAAVAVNEMCVRFGQGGTAYGLGEFLIFFFFFSPFFCACKNGNFLML